jgi:photosystem II stability/assembly factor-like uncharacterized protein
MKRLLIVLTILALLTVAGHPTLAVNNVEHPDTGGRVRPETWNMEHMAGDNFWTQCSQGMWGGGISALALSPDYATDRIIFAGVQDWVGGSIFKSTDGGASWSATGLTGHGFSALALSPGYASDQTLFAGTGNGGVFKSTDGGASWSAVNTGLTTLSISTLALSPGYATDHTLFAGNRSWYSGGHVVYGGVCKSSDGGDSWSDVNTGLTNRNVYALALSPGYATDLTLFAGTEGGGVFRSSDGGASWIAVNAGLTNLDVRGLALSAAYAIDHNLFAGAYGGGVFKSTDGGAFWMAMNEGLGNLFIQSLALTSASPRTIFAGTVGSSIWQYTLLRPYQLWLLRVLKGYGM